MPIGSKKVFKSAFADFYRNKVISLAAILVLTATSLLITGLFFVDGISGFLISTVKNKIDITAYFKQDTSEQDILNAKNQILKDSPEVKNVQYVSKEDALNQFNQMHKGDDVLSRALTEVGGNPFLPSLNITTDGSPNSYQQVSNILEGDNFSNLIDSVDFSQKKDTIDKIYSITSGINKFGIAAGTFLILVVILVVFNTMKLVISNSKDEIGTMRIVGASNWFVQAPFVVEGAIFGLISFGICFFATLILSYFLSSAFAVIVPGFSLFNYFISKFWIVVLIQALSSVGLGALFSFVAVKRYLIV